MGIKRVPILDDSVRADCSCCGSEPTSRHPVFRAGLVDTDGVIFPRLCGPCLDMIEAQIEREVTISPALMAQRDAVRATLVAVHPDELDDVASIVVDHFGLDTAA